MWKEETSTEARARQVHSIKGLHTVRESYSRTSTNGRLSTTATLFGGQVIHWLLFKPFYKGHFFGGHTIHWLLLKPLYNGRLPTTAIFLADIPYIDSCLNLSTTATSLQRPLSSVPKVAVVERLNCIGHQTQEAGTAPLPFLSSPTANMWNIRIRCLKGPCQEDIAVMGQFCVEVVT